MGASFLWRPTAGGKSIGADARSHVGEVPTTLFGGEPWTLQDGEWLRALLAAEPKEGAWSNIATALESYNSIVVWREY